VLQFVAQVIDALADRFAERIDEPPAGWRAVVAAPRRAGTWPEARHGNEKSSASTAMPRAARVHAPLGLLPRGRSSRSGRSVGAGDLDVGPVAGLELAGLEDRTVPSISGASAAERAMAPSSSTASTSTRIRGPPSRRASRR
jgi:hypothetical protein